MTRKIRHHKGKRKPRKFFGRYTALELAMAALGGAILLLIVALVISALVG